MLFLPVTGGPGEPEVGYEVDQDEKEIVLSWLHPFTCIALMYSSNGSERGKNTKRRNGKAEFSPLSNALIITASFWVTVVESVCVCYSQSHFWSVGSSHKGYHLLNGQ